MADVSRFYDGIISPQGGLYSPTPGGLYDGILPSPDLSTRTVQTYPVNGSNWASPAGPSNEVRVPALPAFGNGAQSGYQPSDSYRLLPNPGLPSQARQTSATAAIDAAVPRKYIGTNHPALTLPKSPLPSATPGGLAFTDKFGNALRTAALLRQVGLTDANGKPRPKATQQVTAQMKPRGLLDMLMGGKDGGWQKPSLINMLMNGFAGSQMQQPTLRPNAPSGITGAGYVYQNGVRTGVADWARGLTPSQQYAMANANAAAAAQSNASGGYTPSSSGQSNDYFSIAREGGSSSGGGIEGNGGITGYY